MLSRALAGLQEVSLWYGWFFKPKGLCLQEVEEVERSGVVEGLFKVRYRKKCYGSEQMFKNEFYSHLAGDQAVPWPPKHTGVCL